MDYMAELAEHPNVLEALALLRADVVKGMARAPLEPAAAAALERLSQCSSFLRDEHPHTWVTELIHAFYQTPPLAAAAWKYLRYCAGFRHTLAERLLLEKRRWRLRPEISRDLLAAIPSRLVQEYRTGERVTAIEKLKPRISPRRVRVAAWITSKSLRSSSLKGQPTPPSRRPA